MGDIHHPHRGSMQFWPRKRSKHSIARVRAWANSTQAKVLGFIGYKAGMTQLLVQDNRKNSMTKGEEIAIPATIIDCPPMLVCGIAFYKHSNKVTQILAEKLNHDLGKKIVFPKKEGKKLDQISDFDDLRLLVHSQPKLTSVGAKKPKLMEVVLGGNRDSKLAYAKEMLGKEIKIQDVFSDTHLLDVHGISKGKGFQGTVKRYGVPIRQHKAEKTKRGIGTLGSWTPKRVEYTVANPGKMGYHQRTEYNKELLKIGENVDDINPKGGIIRYGLVKNSYALIKGSLIGPKKMSLVLTPAIRPNKKMTKGAYDLKTVLNY